MCPVVEIVQSTMKSKCLKGLLICLGCFVVGVGLLIAYLRIFSGHILRRVPSPNGSVTVTAEVIDFGPAGATDVGYLGVSLKTRLDPIRHPVFGGSNYGADVRISWIGADVLLIRCEHCERLEGGNILERKWHQVTICYDRSNVVRAVDQDASCLSRAATSRPESQQ